MRKFKMLSFFVLSAVLTFCTGCGSASTWGTVVPMGGKRYPAVSPESVMILFEAPQKKYEEIGIVSSIGGVWANEGDLLKSMQKKAAELGADAIVLRNDDIQPRAGSVKIPASTTDIHYPRTSAIAIKYK